MKIVDDILSLYFYWLKFMIFKNKIFVVYDIIINKFRYSEIKYNFTCVEYRATIEEQMAYVGAVHN